MTRTRGIPVADNCLEYTVSRDLVGHGGREVTRLKKPACLIRQTLDQLDFEIARGKTPFRQTRITSYNVCYTKLLRSDRWEAIIGNTLTATAESPVPRG